MSEMKKEISKEKPNLKYQRDKDREMVKGVFRFFEVPGGSMSFVYKAYKQDQVERYDMVDGQQYTVPLGVAKHLNKNGWYPEYAFVPGDSEMRTGMASQVFGQNQMMRVQHKVRRFAFQSLEFLDIDEFTPNRTLSQVEVVNPMI